MLINAWDNRTVEFEVTICDKDGNAITIDTVGVSDTVRIKIGRNQSAPTLEVTSTGGGNSTVTIKDQTTNTGQVTLRLHQDDVRDTLHPGVWDIEVLLVDDSDGEVIKHAEKGTLVVHRSQGGPVAL